MEALTRKMESFNKALSSLERALKKLVLAQNNSQKFDDEDRTIYRDSCIKRFELSVELFWKVLKLYLEAEHGIEAISPKKVVHACLGRIADQAMVEKLLVMVDDRNVTVHVYDEDGADEITQKLQEYAGLMRTMQGLLVRQRE